MRNSTTIHDLIHSLTKAEKRFFKMYASMHTKGNRNNYILLFDAVDDQDVYDEEKLVHRFRKYSFAKNIAKTKFLLRELILKTLRQLNTNKTTKGKIRELLDSVEIYYQKTLYSNCNALLQRAKKLATENELTIFQKRIVNWEIKLSAYNKTSKESLATLRTSLMNFSNRLILENELQMLIAEIHRTVEEEPRESTIKLLENRLKELIASWSDTIGIEQASFLSRTYYLEAKAIFAQLRFELSLAKEAYEDLLQLWDDRTNLIPCYKEEYLRHALALCYTYINIREDNLVGKKVLENISSLQFVTKQSQEKKDLKLALVEFMNSLALNNLEYATILFFEINKLAKKHERKLEISWRIKLHYLLCVYHFLKGEFKEALHWIEHVKESIQDHQFPTIQNYCKLIGLIINYERGEYNLLEYEIRHVHYYLAKQKQKLPIEDSVLYAVKKLLKVHQNVSETSKIFTELHHSLQTSKEQNDLSKFLGTSAIYHWMKDKLPKDDKVIN